MLRVEPSLKGIVERQVKQRRARTGPSTKPVTTVRCVALQNLQFRATVEGHSFIADEPEHGGGHDAGPAPLRYFLAGLMMCHQVWCVKSAALFDVQLDRLEGEISGFLENIGDADADADRGFERIGYKIVVESPEKGDDILKVVEGANRGCPGFVTITRSTPVVITVVHNGTEMEERVYGRNQA